MLQYLWEITLSIIAVVEILLILLAIPWILSIKKESTAALAWCMVVIVLPIIGFTLFLVFGYNFVYRPLKRKRRHRAGFRVRNPALHGEAAASAAPDDADRTWKGMGDLAAKLGAFPVTGGNRVALFRDGPTAFHDMLEAMKQARHHIHLEYFIVHSDAFGQRVLELAAQKAKEGVEVRLLYDAIGSRRIKRRLLRPFLRAGGLCSAFLPVNPFRRRIQVNLRNHRKITVVDGRIAYTGGLNLGKEYLGEDTRFGYWRDDFARIEGPAVADLQRTFVEDWDFATAETLKGAAYFPELVSAGAAKVQIVASGPDQEVNSLRELLFAAISNARERLWIATPYLVPDSGILDALRLAARLGVDVRILMPQRPDHWLTFFAGCYYLPDLLQEGIRVYHYAKGMMHAKSMMIDGQWAYVGSGNLDNRSLHLNFEVNCVFHSPEQVRELETSFGNDLRESIRLEPRVFAGRSLTTRLAENFCRLLSPVL